MWSLLCMWMICTVFAADPQVLGAEERYNFFNIDLFQKVNEDTNGNVIMSPSSAKVALTSLVEGTGGHTRQQLLSVLRLPLDEYTIRRIARHTIASLKTHYNGTEIDVVTRLWISPIVTMSNYYVKSLQEHYGADIQQINFRDTNSAVQTINNWVRDATHNNIKSIVRSGTLDPNTQLLLTSALYFKGRWLKSFDRGATRVRCFHVPQHGCRNVPMMENTSKYRYAYVTPLDADVVELPYSDGRTSMLIFLPNHENDPHLSILSRDLSRVSMRALLANLEETDVLLSIPKFSIESKLNLRSPLVRMGIVDIFDTGANFTGIMNNDYLRIENILQNAKIEVDEEGTIAAAVTELAIVPLMANTAQTFIANRPFIFAIVDLQSAEILFAGRFTDPNQINSNTT